MLRRQSRLAVPGFLGVALLFVGSACQCNKGGNLGTNYGEIGVAWRDASGNRLVNRDATYDFGSALSGDSKKLTMTVRNVGTAKLNLSKLELASGDPVAIGATSADEAFQVKFTPVEVNPTEQVEFEMVFTPKALKGNFLSVLTLTGEGARPEDSTATITLKGGGEKGACDLPDRIDFGSVQVGESQPYSLDFLNPTTLEATGSVGDFMGTDAASFAFAEGSPKGSITVAPMTTSHVIITFSPTEKRDYAATVVAKGAGGCTEKTITITGKGGDDTLSWTPNDLAFGFVNPGSDAVKQVVFTNPAGVPVVLTGVATTMPSDFFQKVDAGGDETKFVVAPGGTSAMNVACSPSGLGARTAKLTFSTGLKKTPTGTISLTCTGGGPKIKVTPRPDLAFGKVGYFPNSSFSVNRKVTVQNVGGRPPVPDITANLFLGQVVNGTPGQGAPFEFTPGPGTDASELMIGLASGYDGAKGIEAIAGANFVDFLVTLTPKSVGMKSGTLTIYSNDASDPMVTINVTADVQTLPPCNYSISPSMVDFGLVTPGTTKDLPITITNLGTGSGDICYLSGIDLAAGTSPAFTLVGGPVVEKQLNPSETWDVIVRLSPPGPVPKVLTTLTGTLRFNVTSPTNPQGNVSLKASIGPSCLAVTPDPQDFGTTKIGCNSSSRTFNIYNICTDPIKLNSVTMQAAAGQPAGGPNCSGSSACPEFFLSSTPAPNTPVAPGAAPVQFQAKYRPIDVGSDSGAIALNVIQSGQTVTYLVGLVGLGDTTGQQTDTFVQDAMPKADILVVVDDSGSMQDKQASLAANFNSFIQYAASAMVDYQIGVTSTTKTNAGDEVCLPFFGCQKSPGSNSKAPGGVLYRGNGFGPILTSRSRNIPQTFAQMVNLGTEGSGVEQGLETATMALTPPVIAAENAGFLRTEANLAIVVVSDAGDQSPQAVTYYQNRLINIKGFNRLSMFTFNNIGPYLPMAPGRCSYDDSHDAQRYEALVNATSGVKDEICTTSWATALQGLGKTAFGFRTQFFLNNTPDQTVGKLLEVKINDVIAPATAWMYDSSTNSIKFNPTTAPAPGQTLTVRYDTQCF